MSAKATVNTKDVHELSKSPIDQQWVGRVAWESFPYYSRLREVERYLHDHMADPLTVRDAARVACCEYKYFSAYFRAKVRVRFTDWVRLVRVAEAARLVRTEDLTVYETARRVGFRNVRALERAFQFYCGCTLVSYKNAVRPTGIYS